MGHASTPTLRRTSSVLLLVLGVSLINPPGARAEPPTSRITAVFDADGCGGGTCEPGSDPQLKEGARVSGDIQIHVTSEATFGLEWIRLEAHLDGRPPQEWVCLQLWRPPAGTFEFTGSFTWSTARWPDPPAESECEETAVHFHGGKPSRNGGYDLRAIARERSPEREIGTDTPVFPVVLENVATPPSWAQNPIVSSGDGAPIVQLRWRPSAEDAAHPPNEPVSDIVEYSVVRIDPDGSRARFTVNAAAPTAQGCRRLSSLYQCSDDAFTAGDHGEYRYKVFALRGGGTKPCGTAPGPCVSSDPSATRAVTIASNARGEGVASPRATASVRGTRTTTGLAPSDPAPSSPSDSREGAIAAPPGSASRRVGASAPDKRFPVAVALTLLFGLSYAQSRRFWSEVS